MRKTLIAALVALAPAAALAQQPAPSPQQNLAQDWQILSASKTAMDGAMGRVQQDLNAVLNEAQQKGQDLAAAQRTLSAQQKEIDVLKKAQQAATVKMPSRPVPHAVPHPVPLAPMVPR
jgi:hypothetical protein